MLSLRIPVPPLGQRKRKRVGQGKSLHQSVYVHASYKSKTKRSFTTDNAQICIRTNAWGGSLPAVQVLHLLEHANKLLFWQHALKARLLGSFWPPWSYRNLSGTLQLVYDLFVSDLECFSNLVNDCYDTCLRLPIHESLKII